MKNKLKYLITIFSLVLLSTLNVNAATTRTLTVDTSTSNRLYLNTTSESSYSSEYTYYNKKVGDKVAYCVQLNRQIPQQNLHWLIFLTLN